MNHRNLLLIILLVVMAGEALVLWLGMVVLVQHANSWLTNKNITMLMLDGFCALLFVLTFMLHSGAKNQIILLIALTLAGISHAYRVVEFLSPVNDPFCFNLPLFFVNDSKLLVILIVFFQFFIH